MMNYSYKKFAFTLAEVLITLGIIGVVAAMTIPTLIAKYTETMTISKLKKAYATITNVYKLSMIDNGYISSAGTDAEAFVDKYFLPYFSGVLGIIVDLLYSVPWYFFLTYSYTARAAFYDLVSGNLMARPQSGFNESDYHF